jgi:hypothetical protein
MIHMIQLVCIWYIYGISGNIWYIRYIWYMLVYVGIHCIYVVVCIEVYIWCIYGIYWCMWL